MKGAHELREDTGQNETINRVNRGRNTRKKGIEIRDLGGKSRERKKSDRDTGWNGMGKKEAKKERKLKNMHAQYKIRK